MADVKHFHRFLSLDYAENHAIDVRLVAVEQVPEFGVLRCNGTSIRVYFEAENGLPETLIPAQCGIGVLSVIFACRPARLRSRGGKS